MKRLGVASIGVVVLLLTGCARHFVVPRDTGRVDGARSISSYSDQTWTIVHEPAPVAPAAPAAAPQPAP